MPTTEATACESLRRRCEPSAMAGTKPPSWSDLSKRQRSAIIAGAVVQLTLMAAAQIDLTRRSADQVRGPKLLWRFLVLINFIGPIGYFVVGRRKVTESPTEPEDVAADEPAA